MVSNTSARKQLSAGGRQRAPGNHIVVNVLFPPDLLAKIERYRGQALARGESKIPSRLDAIRELIQLGLNHSAKT
jgi:hypothetical protein